MDDPITRCPKRTFQAGVKSKIEKVPRDIQGDKSGKGMAVRGIWSQELEYKQVQKRGTELEGKVFPAGMQHPLQMLNGNHS